MQRARMVRDVIAVLLCSFGVVLFSVEWLVGIALGRLSTTWTSRDKVLAEAARSRDHEWRTRPTRAFTSLSSSDRGATHGGSASEA